MFIQTEDTPNPLTIKFLPGKEVMKSGTADFTSEKDTKNSPLARRLFEVEGVNGIFLGSDFISVTKSPEQEWFSLKPAILGKIMEHYASNEDVIIIDKKKKDKSNEEDTEVVQKINSNYDLILDK